MTKRMLIALLAAAVSLSAVSALAQANSGEVKGKVIDDKGKPLASGTIRMTGPDGKKIEVHVKDGEWVKTGLPVGRYKVELVVARELRWQGEGDVLAGQTVQMNIDLAAGAAMSKLSPEEQKKIQQAEEEKRKKVEAERSKIKNLNAMLAQGKEMVDAGNFDGAIGIYQDAVKADPSRDLLWANLGGAYMGKAKKTTDSAEKKQVAQQGADALKKAVEIKPSDAAYHNNLAQAYNLQGDLESAIKEYQQAAQIDPLNAGQYYFNLGAVYTNAGKVDEALAAFEKTIAADPNNAPAYYWKGVNLLAKATIDPKTNKMLTPPGTAEAFNKYLELAPDGQLAQPAKDMLTSIGASVETSYKKTGTKKK
ncbi:MAG TPA: tetratricopeptide repeat protein [Terriglobales bacterium]|nr:tetratricopeptide repeat protein [Terriglobales bacterium]